MALQFNVQNKVTPKILINIGALFDIPTCSFITGAKGESIINGGLGQNTGIVGAGNNYKSTINHYFMLSAANKMKATADTAMTTYDTEVNISIDRLETFARKHKYLPDNPITDGSGLWDVTDKSLEVADKWFTGILGYAEAKAKDKSLVATYTAFKDPYTKKELTNILPTFVEIDSLSEFEAESTVNMIENGIEDSNTVYMKQGLFKNKVLGTLPRVSNTANIYFLLTAQIGEKINMATGPAMYQQPTKKLQYLKAGDTIKGVSGKFFYLLNNAWFAHTATLLNNSTTKTAEYPRDNGEAMETDLNVVRLTQLRSKTGPSGYTLEIIVSQSEGVLPALTEFHHIKTNGKFGIDGNDRSYFLELMPDVKLSRTTVRNKLSGSILMKRAVNITSELLQIAKFHTNIKDEGLLCTPAELYKDLIALGYDWDILLRTRGWWTVDNYSKQIEPFLSVLDLLKMRKGLYTPYFLDKDKKLKKEYEGSLLVD